MSLRGFLCCSSHKIVSSSLYTPNNSIMNPNHPSTIIVSVVQNDLGIWPDDQTLVVKIFGGLAAFIFDTPEQLEELGIEIMRTGASISRICEDVSHYKDDDTAAEEDAIVVVEGLTLFDDDGDASNLSETSVEVLESYDEHYGGKGMTQELSMSVVDDKVNEWDF